MAGSSVLMTSERQAGGSPCPFTMIVALGADESCARCVNVGHVPVRDPPGTGNARLLPSVSCCVGMQSDDWQPSSGSSFGKSAS